MDYMDEVDKKNLLAKNMFHYKDSFRNYQYNALCECVVHQSCVVMCKCAATRKSERG